MVRRLRLGIDRLLARRIHSTPSAAATAEHLRVRDFLAKEDFEGVQQVTALLESGDPEEARRFFDREVSHLDARVWNAVIAALSKHEDPGTAVEFLHRMLQDGIRPNVVTLVTVVKECINGSTGSKRKNRWIIKPGKLVECVARESGLDLEDRIGTTLVNMYRICGSVEDAHRVFLEFESPSNVVTWTGIIAANAESGHFEEAIALFHRTQLQGVLLDKTSFLAVLNACADCGDLVNGRLAHRLVGEAGLEADIVLANTIINMYGLCHSVDEACSVFEAMEERTSVSWNVMLSAHARQGNFHRSLLLFQFMQLEGFKPKDITFLAVLEACAAVGSIDTGRIVHSNIQEETDQLDSQIADAVINMYGKCGSVEDAVRVFDGLGQRKSVVSWNSMVAAFFLGGLLEEAFQCFWTMQLEGFCPNAATFVNILHGCSELEALREGESVHTMLLRTELQSVPAIENALVTMYSSCGEVDAAYEILRNRDEVHLPWSTFLRATARYGCTDETVVLFRRMLLNGIAPNTVAFVSGLSACVSPSTLQDGITIHNLVRETGSQDQLVVATALFVMYGKCKNLDSARLLFDGMPQRDSVAWSAAMSLYASYGRHEDVVRLFRGMKHDGVVCNRAGFCIVLSCLVDPSMIFFGETVHSIAIQENCAEDELVAAALVIMYARLGQLDRARQIFDKVCTKEATTALWTAMISACIEHKQLETAWLLFRRMQLEGVPADGVTLACVVGGSSLVETKSLHATARLEGLVNNVRMSNALVEAYCSQGQFNSALEVFESTEEKTQLSWSIIISAAADSGKHHEGLVLYRRMLLEGWQPDRFTFVTAAGICSSLESLKAGRGLHDQLAETGLNRDQVVATTLVDMFGKCGSLESSITAFESSQRRDPVLWNSLLAVLAQHGSCGEDVKKLFHYMQQDGSRPDAASFVSVLAAFDHAGLENEAWNFFSAMEWDFGVVPASEHFGCMVDLLARSGKLEVAEELIVKSRLKLDSRLWIMLLAACNANGDVKRGERAGMNALVLNPENSGLYVTLGNMFAAAGRVEDALNVKKALDGCDPKDPGI